MKIRILAFSSSKEGSYGYLETAAPVMKNFLGVQPLNIAFIPFASVDADYEDYTSKVRNALQGSDYAIITATHDNAKAIIENADVIITGGGNTFKLLHDLYDLQLMEVIKEKVRTGTPYIGWSAGANLAGETISTSNDMPIINPGSFKALEFFPFHINPHYYNQPITGFNGETRDQRLKEFLQLNPTKRVIALPEGATLLLEEETLQLIGHSIAYLFQWENNAVAKKELSKETDLSFLLS
ncbi:MAG: dipeptidase PepE [Chitinophagaceae bacterium]